MSTRGGFVRDNIEAFAVAIAMALVIRHFCVEAFRIPTGSMMPTLLGDRVPDMSDYQVGDTVRKKPGDRILVDKFAWLLRDPRRFEVAVFQYPLNRTKNFIKRIAGLPGDWLRIVDGDLWVSRDEGKTWDIQRKPDGARDQLLFAYYPEPADDVGAFSNVTCWEGDDGWKIDEAARRFEVAAGDTPTGLEFSRKVLPYDGVDDSDYAPKPHVGDVRVAFDLETDGNGELSIRIMKHGVDYRLALGAKESYLEWGPEKKREPVSMRLASGPVSFAHVDDTLHVEVDGDAIAFDLPERTTPPSEVPGDDWGHHRIRIEATSGKSVLTDLRIDRDVHYANNGDDEFIWKIPEDHYFMLGDNTQQSKDSRAWFVAEAYMRNGDVVRWEVHPNDGTRNPPGAEAFGGPDAFVHVLSDISGLVRRIKNRDVEKWVAKTRWPFVSKDHLIGRAFAVFWPVYLPPISQGATRVKLIR